jgi:hypothetical protein
LVNTAAFLSIYGASFLLKYRIFHRIFHVQHPNVPQATLDLTAADGERTPAN